MKKRYQLYFNGVLVHESNSLTEEEWLMCFIPGSKIWDDFDGIYLQN
jgi:hypothetical protein